MKFHTETISRRNFLKAGAVTTAATLAAATQIPHEVRQMERNILQQLLTKDTDSAGSQNIRDLLLFIKQENPEQYRLAVELLTQAVEQFITNHATEHISTQKIERNSFEKIYWNIREILNGFSTPEGYKYREDTLVAYTHIDTRKENDKKDDDPLYISLHGTLDTGQDNWKSAYPLITSQLLPREGSSPKGIEMVSVSLPGHGGSTDFPHGWGHGNMDIKEAASNIYYTIKRYCEKNGYDPRTKPFVVYGHSMGGTVAIELARILVEHFAMEDYYDSQINVSDFELRGRVKLILTDVPAFPNNHLNQAAGFVGNRVNEKYGTAQTPLIQDDTNSDDMFRILGKRKIRVSTVAKAAHTLTKVNLGSDVIDGVEPSRTLEFLARDQVPLLQVRPTPQNALTVNGDGDMITEIYQQYGGYCEDHILTGVGHSLEVQKPIELAMLIQEFVSNTGETE